MTTKQVKKYIIKYYKWWVHWLGLNWWNISLVIVPGKADECENGFVIGKCDADWKYLNGIIRFWPKSMRHMSKWQIRNMVIHELMHVFLNEMRFDNSHEHEERTATQLQKSFVWVMNGAKK